MKRLYSSMESQGLHIDDLQKLRVLEPSLATESENLKNECAEFVQGIADFRKMAQSLIEITDKVDKKYSPNLIMFVYSKFY